MRVPDTVLTIQMFGELHVSVNAQPVPPPPIKVQQLLALLVLLGQERPLSRAWLAETLWPGSSAQRQMLRSAVFTLRESLGSARNRLPTENRKTLRLDLSGASVDVLEFDRAIALGEDERAVRLYRGELLKGWPEEWAHRERELRAQAYAGALERLHARAGHQPRTRQEELAPDNVSVESPPAVQKDGLGSGQRELARLRALVTESRMHLMRAATALEQLERRVALLEAEQPGPAEVKRNEPDSIAASGEPDRQSGKTLYDLAVAAMVRGAGEEAEEFFAQALAIFTRPPGARAREADILHKMGGLALRKGEYPLARKYAERCCDIRAEIKDGQGMVGALLLLGDATLGDQAIPPAKAVAQAIAHFEQASQVSVQENYPEGNAWAAASMALAPLFRGTWTPDLLPDTTRHFQSALATFMAHDISTGVFTCLDGMVRLLWAAGRQSEAVMLLSDCNALRAEHEVDRSRRQQEWFRHLLEEGRQRVIETGAHDDPKGQRGQQGEPTLEQAVRFANRWLRNLSRSAQKLKPAN